MGKTLYPCAKCKKSLPEAEMTKARWLCKVCWRVYMRFQRYGISEADYNVLLIKQGNTCAICGGYNIVIRKNGNVNGLAVDHAEGRVRGLLCGMCNRGLGYFRDNPEFLSRAARYVVGWHS